MPRPPLTLRRQGTLEYVYGAKQSGAAARVVSAREAAPARRRPCQQRIARPVGAIRLLCRAAMRRYDVPCEHMLKKAVMAAR